MCRPLSLRYSGFINKNHLGAERKHMDFTEIFGGNSLTLEQFLEKTKDMKLFDLAKGGYVAKGKYDSDIERLKGDLNEANAAIAALEQNKDDAEALKAELLKYRQAESERQAQAEKEAERAKLIERFQAAKGDREFSSSFTENGVLEAFSAALKKPENLGKGDAELFASLTNDQEGVFKSAVSPVNMGKITGEKGAEKPKMPTFF